MVGFLLSPTQFDTDTGEAVISYKTIAAIAGQVAAHRHRNFNAGAFLDRFRDDVFPDFEASAWTHPKGAPWFNRKARRVLNSGLDQADVDNWLHRINVALRDRERSLVYIDNGRRADGRERARRRKLLLDELAATPYGNGGEIATYQHALDPQTFTKKVHANLRDTYDLLQAEAPSPSRLAAFSTWRHIVSEPMPFLGPVARSERLYSVQPSLATVRKDVRRVLTRGWYEYDLRSAQLAIAAKLWNIPVLAKVLRGKKSIWDTICDKLGVSVATHKDGIKTAMYALLFGAGKPRIKDELETRTGHAGLYDGFAKLSVIEALLEARDRHLTELVTTGHGTTVFGTTLYVKDRDAARSVMAQQAQAAEVALILPIYRLARTTDKFKAVLYQFDGVTIQYRDKDAAKAWELRITEAVAEEAKSRGFPTRLEGGLVT